MAILLHHIHPWMQKSIVEAEDQTDNRKAQHKKRKVEMVHQHLDAFELQVLAHPAPTIDLNTLQVVEAILQADVDCILEIRGPEPEADPVKLAKDTVLAALLTAPHCTARAT